MITCTDCGRQLDPMYHGRFAWTRYYSESLCPKCWEKAYKQYKAKFKETTVRRGQNQGQISNPIIKEISPDVWTALTEASRNGALSTEAQYAPLVQAAEDIINYRFFPDAINNLRSVLEELKRKTRIKE